MIGVGVPRLTGEHGPIHLRPNSCPQDDHLPDRWEPCLDVVSASVTTESRTPVHNDSQ